MMKPQNLEALKCTEDEDNAPDASTAAELVRLVEVTHVWCFSITI